MLERVLKEVLCVVNELLICGTPQVIIVIVFPNRALTTVLLITCYLEAQLKFACLLFFREEPNALLIYCLLISC